MINKEEIDVLIKENMKEEAFDILVDDCCEIIREKLSYKKEYSEIYDLKFLLARLYYLDINYKNIILEIYDLISINETENEDIIYKFYSKNQEIYMMNFSRNYADLSQELKFLLSIEKNELARRIIEENYYKKIFNKILRRNNIGFLDEEKFSELCIKIRDIRDDYSSKITRFILEKNELRRIRLLLDFSEDFSNRKMIQYDRKEFEDLTEKWLFENVYKDLKNCFINKFLQMLNKESEEEDLDKLLNELCVEVYMERSDISKECMEINKRIKNPFATNDERNVENIYRLLDLYEFILDK